jgi:hypothetical protein
LLAAILCSGDNNAITGKLMPTFGGDAELLRSLHPTAEVREQLEPKSGGYVATSAGFVELFEACEGAVNQVLINHGMKMPRPAIAITDPRGYLIDCLDPPRVGEIFLHGSRRATAEQKPCFGAAFACYAKSTGAEAKKWAEDFDIGDGESRVFVTDLFGMLCGTERDEVGVLAVCEHDPNASQAFSYAFSDATARLADMERFGAAQATLSWEGAILCSNLDGTLSSRLRGCATPVFFARPAGEVMPSEALPLPALRTNGWYIPIGSLIAPVMKSTDGTRTAFVATPEHFDKYDVSVRREVTVIASPPSPHCDDCQFVLSPMLLFLKTAELAGIPLLDAVDKWSTGGCVRVAKETRRRFDAFLQKYDVAITSAMDASFSHLLAAILENGSDPLVILEAAAQVLSAT